MRELPKGGLIGKSATLWRAVAELRIPVYAANACYFIVLAVFPALVLLLGVLQYTPLEVERFTEMLSGIFPDALLEGAEELILLTYDKTSASVLGVSAVTLLWSASRGGFGVLTGLNAVYGVAEDRGYFHIRLISVGYTFALILVLLLTLGLHVFGTAMLTLIYRASHPFWKFVWNLVDLRFFVLLFTQTAVFTAMFMALPNRHNRFWDSLPGALFASSGWLIFSDLYSIYVTRFASLQSVYGPVYAVALSMLWLYCCMSIVFYGGALNRFLMRWK